MDPITRKLVETVRQITEQNKTTLTPTPGIHPITGQRLAGPPVPTPDLKEAAMSDTLKAGLASLIIGGGIGAIGGVATPHLANLRSTVQDKMGQVVGVENAGNIERSKQEVRSQLGLGANTPATTRAAVGAGLGGLAGLFQSWRKRNNV